MRKGNIVSFKIVLYFVLVFLFTGCFRVIPESAVLPKIHMDKKFTKSKKMTFNDDILSVNSPNGGLVVLNRDNGFTFINPNTNEKIKELDKTYLLAGDLPYPIFSKYDKKLNKTVLECTDSKGTKLWKKSINGKLLNTYDDTQSIILAIKDEGVITLHSLNKKDAKVKWSVTKETTSSNVLFLNNEGKVYVATDKSLDELSSNGKLIHRYDFNTKFYIKRFIINGDSMVVYGYTDEKSKAIVKAIDIASNKIVFEKSINIEDDLYNDVLVDNRTLYIVNNKKLSSFDMLNGNKIKNIELKMEDDSYETLDNIAIYKDKILLTGQSEIYAYTKKDLNLLWKHEELWTPDRLFRKEKGFNAAVSAGMAASFQTFNNVDSVNGRGGILGSLHLAQSQFSFAVNKILKKLNLSKSSKGSLDIAFVRGYSTGSVFLEYDAVVYLINLDTGKSQNIQLKERDSYHCYPNVHVDVNNRTIYQSYGTQNLILSCGTLNQLDIIKY